MENCFFKSQAAEYAFALIKLDREARMNILGITESHYSDKDVADQWKMHIETVIITEGEEEFKDLALLRLYELYNRMIKR